jgi:hypothetical protein
MGFIKRVWRDVTTSAVDRQLLEASSSGDAELVRSLLSHGGVNLETSRSSTRVRVPTALSFVAVALTLLMLVAYGPLHNSTPHCTWRP